MRALSVVVALLLVAGVATVACVTEITGPTFDPAIVAALKPACEGHPVAGSGTVETDRAAPNHVVVLDENGETASLAAGLPAGWTPASLADTELVTCIEELPPDEIQVCPYIGTDITRYSVTDDFLVVEPASGRTVAQFSITAEPRLCAPTENASTTTLYGSIDPEMIAAHLASLVANGTYVDPDATDGLDGSGKPDGTPDSNSPSMKPTGNPSGDGDAVELRAALADGLVTAAGAGDSLQSLDLELTSEVDQSLEISIEPGTMLDPRARATQTMMVVWGTTVTLEARSTETISLDVACVQMHRDQPSGEDTFTVTRADPEPDMARLLQAPALAEADGRVTQFAVWTISNNPKRNDYVGLTSGFSVFGSGPNAEELDEIRALFESAGIDTDKYRALR